MLVAYVGLLMLVFAAGYLLGEQNDKWDGRVEPGEYTEDEVRDRFIAQIHSLVEYWTGRYNDLVLMKSPREKLEGLAFSILVMLDGESAAMPGFIVAPLPHPDDKEWHKERAEKWYPENHESNVRCDIAGGLHDLFHERRG